MIIPLHHDLVKHEDLYKKRIIVNKGTAIINDIPRVHVASYRGLTSYIDHDVKRNKHSCPESEHKTRNESDA